MEALHQHLLAAAGHHPLHLAIAALLGVSRESIHMRLDTLSVQVTLVALRDLVALNADHETPYEALMRVSRWVHGDENVQRLLEGLKSGLRARATMLVWFALRLPHRADVNACAILALRQGEVNALREWTENPQALVTAWNEVTEPGLRDALAYAILRSAHCTQSVTAEVVDAITHQLPPALAHETAKALVEHHVRVVGEPQLSLEIFLTQRNLAFAMAFLPRLGADADVRRIEEVVPVLRQYI